MTKTVKKMAAVALSAAMLSTAVAVTLPWALADGAASQAPDARGWKVATVEDFDSMEVGASYPNWDSYYSRVADEAKAGAGYNESQGLYIHSLENGDGKTYVQPYYAMGKEGSFSNAQELWIWFDFTGYTAKDINIRPRVTGLPEGESTGVQYNLALTSDAPIYYQADDGTVTVSSASTVLKDGAVNPLGDAKLRGADLTGFKGFVRIPLSSFHVQNKADKIDTGYSITKVDGIYFIYDFTMAVDDNEDYVETGYVMDQVLFVGPTVNSEQTVADMLGLSAAAPDASSWKKLVVEDFDSMEAGASYPNWDSYYSRAADEAKAGAGYNESQGLYIHSLENGDGKTYVQPYYAMGKEGSFSNAQELWIWFDFTGYTAKDINIRPRVTGLPEGESTGVQYNLALTSDAPIYYQADDGTVTVSSASTVLKDGAVNPLGDAKLRGADLTGFKGFVRIPLSSFHVQNKADKIDTGYSITKVDGIYFIYDFTMAVDDNEDYVETGYVMDQILFAGPAMTEPTVSTAATTQTTQSSAAATTETSVSTSATTATTSSAPAPVDIPNPSNWKYALDQGYEDKEAGVTADKWFDGDVVGEILADGGFGGSKAYALKAVKEHVGSAYMQPFFWIQDSVRVEGAREYWIWVDCTEYPNPDNLRIRPRVYVDSLKKENADGTYTYTNVNLKMKPGAPVYFQTTDGWRASTLTDSDDPAAESSLRKTDLAGFKGFIRVPLTSFNPDADVVLYDETIVSMQGAYFIFNFDFEVDDMEEFLPTSLVFDNIMLVGDSVEAPVAGTVSNLLSGTPEPTETSAASTETSATPTETSAAPTESTATPTDSSAASSETSAASTDSSTASTDSTGSSKSSAASTEASASGNSSAADTTKASPVTGEKAPLAMGTAALLAVAAISLVSRRKK